VHLWVYTPAKDGPNAPTGGFQEFDVPQQLAVDAGLLGTPAPGCWAWPRRV
jgi:hypothetical protein